uniref:Uncharacterized protein n=1 Tax=Kalanchoe fedtschenkoi TaxID=63787 RepID=A0A7N0U1J2_KALFE
MLDLTNLHYLFHLCTEPCLIGMVIKPVLMEKFHNYLSSLLAFSFIICLTEETSNHSISFRVSGFSAPIGTEIGKRQADIIRVVEGAS